MISANDLRAVQFRHVDKGYNIDEVNAVLDKAADTIDAQANENKELYHKLEVLAARVEEYRSEEDSIKTALITAQKMADKITKEAQEESDKLLHSSRAEAEATVAEAKAQSEALINEARNYATELLTKKTTEADGIISDAEQKANEAVSSAKIVAQDIVSQAKANYDDLTSKAKEEKEAYTILISTLKNDAAAFIEQLKLLYAEQFSKLEKAKIDTSEPVVDDGEVEAIHSEADNLLNEIEDIQQSIPETITIEKTAPAEEAPAAQDEVEEIIEEISEPVPEEAAPSADPREAVEAFSQSHYSPIDTTKKAIPEIQEEAPMEEQSLFDTDGHQPFENFFDVSTKDAHLDKSQQISLLPPDDDDSAEEEKGFRGFFKKRK